MTAKELVKKLYELNVQPMAYFPPETMGNPVVAIYHADDRHDELPEGYKTAAGHKGVPIHYWPLADWEKEFGKRDNFINSGDDAAKGEWK